MTINDLISHYIKAKVQFSGLSPSLLEKMPHLVSAFGHLDASATGQEIVAAAKKRWGGNAPGTIKRYLVQLRAVFNRAEADGLIAKAPLIDMPYVHDVVYVDITAQQLDLLLDYIRWTEIRWYPLALLLSHTGARLNEALEIGEGSFTRQGVRIIKSTGRKTKTVERVIPYSSRMTREIANGIFSIIPTVPDGIGRASVPTCLGRVLDTSTKALGLPELRVHDLRHAFAAVLAEKGADLADIASALGHSNPTMAMRYRGLVKGRLNDLLAAV